MTVERSPLLPHQLEEVRERIRLDMDHHMAQATVRLKRADRLRRKAQRAWGVFRIFWTWRAHVNECAGRDETRRYLEIRRALKDDDEARVGHRHIRRVLHRDTGAR